MEILEETIKKITEFITAYIVIVIALATIPYIFHSVGLYSIAKALRMKNKWMSWIPIARSHVMAEIADMQRVRVGKEKRLETQIEILYLAIGVCGYIAITKSSIAMIILAGIFLFLYSVVRTFSYYYFYRLCDKENATIYFVLGIIAKPLNSFFVFCCRQ